MKKFSQITLITLCIGLLAVALSSLHSRSASAQNKVEPIVYEATHLGVPFVNLFTLECTSYSATIGTADLIVPCAQFTFINLNGTLGANVVPSQATGNLVITDVSWTVEGSSTLATVDTFCLSTTSNACILSQTGVNFWPNMIFSEEDHLTGGVAVTVMPGVTLTASQGALLLTQLTISGYRSL
jgi:hypothetical protein